MSKPEVSIITPLYNAAKYIADTVECVQNQSLKDFEWVIIDDCSTDDSLSILEKFKKNDERIKIISLKQNSGPIVARNTGFEAATGRFIALIDADDLWLPEKLEFQINKMKEKNVVLSCTAYKKINRDGSLRSGLKICPPGKISYKKITFTDSIMASSAIIDTELSGSVKQSVDVPVGRDDYDFFLKLLKDYGDGIGIKKDLARLRVHNDSITGNKKKAAKMQWMYYRKVLDLNLFTAVQKFIVYSIVGFIKYIL